MCDLWDVCVMEGVRLCEKSTLITKQKAKDGSVSISSCTNRFSMFLLVAITQTGHSRELPCHCCPLDRAVSLRRSR